MEIIKDWPPNIDLIDPVLKVRKRVGVIFCYGDRIYSPHAGKLNEYLLSHESIHSGQQLAMGVDAWWERYLSDVAFRYSQELPAHVMEFKRFCELNNDRGARSRYAGEVAKRLSGPIYGNIVTFDQAKKALKEG